MFKNVTILAALVFMTTSVSAQNYPGAVKKYDLALQSSIQFNKNQPMKKSFQGGEVEGWLQDKGDWYIKGTVKHNRLRCATYQLGVQLGKGSPACINIEWLTDVEYGTLKQHCNSASLEHVGGGELPMLANVLKDATCVRVVVRCSGTCDGAEK